MKTEQITRNTVADPALSHPLADRPMKWGFQWQRTHAGYILLLVAASVAVLLLGACLILGGRNTFFADRPATPDVPAETPAGDYPFADGKDGLAQIPFSQVGKDLSALGLNATDAVLADLEAGEIRVSLGDNRTIYPVSMTKVMTLIVAVENLPNAESLQKTVTISQSAYDQMTGEGASGIGFEAGERVTVEALLYALMLKSDGIAACELANFVAGSEAGFVKLMNEKAASMGLEDTHFENPTGLHHNDHVSSVRDIASIMAYAMDMQLCRKILTAEAYHAPCTGADGKQFTYDLYHNLLVTQFDKVSPNQPTDVTVIAGKTGYTPESGFCLVTYAENAEGKSYVCVTAGGESYADCIADYLKIYNRYAAE